MKQMATAFERANEELISTVNSRATECEQKTICNARDFIDVLRSSKRAAPRVGGGYWPTICLSWDEVDAESLQIEIFADHFEIYRFSDGRTEIRYEQRQPGEPFPASLLNEVPLADDDPSSP